MFAIILFLYLDILFKFFLFVPILIYSPPANCTGCFSAQGISINTTLPSSIGTSKNRKLILGESILESHASNSSFPFFHFAILKFSAYNFCALHHPHPKLNMLSVVHTMLLNCSKQKYIHQSSVAACYYI